jgi:hypothetical protein
MMPRMKRHLLILLMLILPLQASWAAVSAYCKHETGKAAEHFGHHYHQHQAQSSTEVAKAKGSVSQADSDCGFCHQAAPAPLVPHVAKWVVSANKSYIEPLPILFSSHIPERLVRPDRRAVA